jgi:hypothetical protein
MPLTLSRSGAVKRRRVAATAAREAAAEALSPTRTTVDGLILGQARKARPTRPLLDVVEEWGMQSFPASDPPMNW